MIKHLTKILFGLILTSTFSLNAKTKIDLTNLTFKNPNQPYANIITGGQPSLKDLNTLKDLGINNIVNLRTKGEFDKFDEASEVEKLGMKYVTLEIAGSSGITLDNAKKLDVILKEMEGNTLVHCASSNRVGALFAVRANAIQRKSIDRAMFEGKSAGMKSLTEKTKSLLIELSK